MTQTKELPALEGGKPVRDTYLTFGAPLLEEDEIQEVVASLRSGWIGTGPKTRQFAQDFKTYVGAPFAVPTNSCTSALHLSLAACGVKAGDEVITTPMTFAATANVIIHCGARPVFADVEPGCSFLIDQKEIEKKITPKTRAIVPVHFAGLPVDLDAILAIAKKHKLFVIEDAAHAAGTEYKGRRIGTAGDFACFSFYVTKNMTTGEGGMVTTKNEELAKKVEIMALHGLSLDAWKRFSDDGFKHYDVVYPGYKYNMTDMAASLGLHQLKKLDTFIEKRKEICMAYEKQLADLEDAIILPKDNGRGKHAWHLYTVLLKPGALRISRDQFMAALHKENIGMGVHYRAVHLQPYYADTFGYKRGDFPNAEFISDNVVSFPLSSKMTQKDTDDSIKALRKVIQYYKK